MFRGFLRPGQGFQTFTINTRQNSTTAAGRPTTGELVESGKLDGIISTATQQEQQQWKQNGHPITHTILQQYTGAIAKATDVLTLEDRKFLVKGVGNPGELNHFFLYYVEERMDLQ